MARPEAKAELVTLSEKMETSILFKFIKPFDGSRDKLQSFLNNCENANKLASITQKPILLNYILSRLEGKAESAASIKDFDSWEQVKSFLQSQFGETKHYAHLLSELQELQQQPDESVSQYSLKIESCLAKLITEITISNKKKTELSGKISAMEELALHSFLMGLSPKICNLIRMKNPSTLNEAINFAISEEKIQAQLLKKRNLNRPFQKPNIIQNQSRSNAIHNLDKPQSSPPVCRYCKFEGHTLENCKKRQYNNNRFKFNQNDNFQRPQTNNNRVFPRQTNTQNRVSHVEYDNQPQDFITDESHLNE